MEILLHFWWILVILVIIFSGLVTVNQGTIAVITLFGKYQRILHPGLNFNDHFVRALFQKKLDPLTTIST